MCFALQYRIYSVKDEKDGKSLPFMLCDSMGLNEKDGVGLCVDDIPHILKGCMPDRYQVRILQCLKHFKSFSSVLLVDLSLHKAVSTVIKVVSTPTNNTVFKLVNIHVRKVDNGSSFQ